MAAVLRCQYATGFQVHSSVYWEDSTNWDLIKVFNMLAGSQPASIHTVMIAIGGKGRGEI